MQLGLMWHDFASILRNGARAVRDRVCADAFQIRKIDYSWAAKHLYFRWPITAMGGLKPSSCSTHCRVYAGVLKQPVTIAAYRH